MPDEFPIPRLARSAAASPSVGRLHAVQKPAEAAQGCAACAVRHLAVCHALAPDAAHDLEALSADVSLKAGQWLAREGDVRRNVYTVTKGAMRSIRELADGRRLVVGFLMPGDYIGFTRSSHYRHSIEAITDCTLCTFPLSDMRDLCQRHPDLERELLERACLELDSTQDKLLLLARMTPVERLAVFLLDMSVRRKRQGHDEKLIVLPMSRTDIADYLGLTIETVSRSFTKLRTQGLIATDDPQHVRLLKMDALASLAEALN